MFVRYSTIAPVGLGEFERRLDNVRGHLEVWAGVAYREGEDLRARVGPGGHMAKSVSLELGAGEIHRRGVVYAVRWDANGGGVLFPKLTAELVLSQMGADMTSVTLDGTYDPPMGVVGRALDRAMLGKVAEATVRNWVDKIADEVSAGH